MYSEHSTDQQVNGQQTVDQLATLFAVGMPNVEPYISEQIQPQKPETVIEVNPKYAGLTDKYKRPFNPELHETDPVTGDPVLTRDGNLKRKPGRPRLKAVEIQTPQEKIEAKQQQTTAQMEAAQETCALIAVNCFFTVTVSIFGDDWKPNKEAGYDETAQLTAATKQYLAVKGVSDLPPGLALICAYSMYALPRLQKEKTLSKLEKFQRWLFAKWVLWTNRKNQNQTVPTGNPQNQFQPWRAQAQDPNY